MNRRYVLAGLAALGSTGAVRAEPGYYVPAEEERHQLTFMQWPVSRVVYRDRYFLKATQQTIADIANAIVDFEPVVMMAARSDWANAKRMLSSKVDLWDIPTEDLWCRDAGPIFIKNAAGHLAISHIQFNGWGDKQVHKRDGQIASAVAKELKLPLISTGLKGEAGGVEQDGHGLLMAHESSWVNDNRNKGTRAEIEEKLLDAYGAHEIIWTPGVYDEDITDYHIDSLARFTGPRRALINLPENPDMDDPFHKAALETTQALRDAGLKVEVIPEPNERRVNSFDFVASYANYYVCNGAVIAAEFGDKRTDDIAVDALARHYPNREIVTLNVDALGELGGGIHCATHEMPA